MKTDVAVVEQKNIFVVLGMARGGTSAIARGLKALGVDLGENLTPALDKWNPTGFWEDSDIVYKINRGVMYALDYPWMSVSLLDKVDMTNPALIALKDAAIALLKQRLCRATYWGFKDPRTAKLLPFWRAVFADMHVSDHYVIALRHPLAAAHSYQRVSETDVEVGLMLWLMHMIPAMDETVGKQRLVVSYELMLQDARNQLLRIKHHFAIPQLGGTADLDEYANTFLNKELQHFHFDKEAALQHPASPVVPLAFRVYALLLRVAKDEISCESTVFTAEWQAIKNEFKQVYPAYQYIDVLLRRNRQLERDIHSIKKSVLWKLLYPIRLIGDHLRERRRQKREKRRLVKSYG